jgi:hypothetical protein
MYQKDYILRMIDMLGELIAGILGLIQKGNLKMATEKLDKLYQTMLKEDASLFRDLSGDGLTDRLLHQHNFTNGHLEVLAGLFNAEAELCLAQGDKSGTIKYPEKSLILFEFIDRQNKTYSQERLNKMAMIRIMLCR